jgi:cytidyltransferase-like protein
MGRFNRMGFSKSYNLVADYEKYHIAAVNGRFQPLHLGHLEYILAAKKHCDFLCVGITQYDISNLLKSPLDAHREIPENNPLSYFERVEMITEVLLSNGLNFNEFSITPFPIDRIEYLENYIPKEIPIFTTICDEWNINKIKKLESIGYNVRVLFERTSKEYSGLIIRDLIFRGDDHWKNMVPQEAIRVIEKYNIKARLTKLRS